MIDKTGKLLRLPFKLIPIIIFGILLTATLNIIFTNNHYQDLNKRLTDLQANNEVEVWNNIEEIIEENYEVSTLLANQSALEVENQLLRQYPELGDLKTEFKKDNLGVRFHDIVTHNIEQSNNALFRSPYLTLVGTKDDLILASANTENNLMKHIDTSSFMDWESVTSLTPNKELTQQAFESAFNKSYNVVFTQTSNHYVKSTKDMNMEISELKSVFDKEGLRGLYDFSIIAPGFITETGDIFGTEDRYYLSKNNNYKIVILHVISLETILSNDKERIELEIKNNNMEEREIEHFMLRQLITMMAVTLLLFIISLVLIAVHNAETDKNKKDGNVDS